MLDKIRNVTIRQELEITSLSEHMSLGRQIWGSYLLRVDGSRLPRIALEYQPKGKRDVAPEKNMAM